MALTNNDVANMALDVLKETYLTTDFTSGTDPVDKWFNRNYTQTRDELLVRHIWNFAKKRAEWTKNVTDPDWGWSYAYDLPSDYLRMLPLDRNLYPYTGTRLYEIENGQLLTNLASPIKVQYVFQHTTTDDWPPLFVQALYSQLAAKMAHWLTGKTTYVEIANNLYREAVIGAASIDLLEEPPDAPDDALVSVVRA